MKCCICGTVKNCGNYLDNIFKNMEQISSLFDDYVIILYYDNSNDDTLIKLTKYNSINSKMHFYINHETLSQYRTHNIAKGRNYCIQMIREKYSDFEYFIMMDCDDRCSNTINLNILKESLDINEQWDSLSFNRSDYYDYWAVSIGSFAFSYWHVSSESQSRIKEYLKHLFNNNTDNNLISCYSAFNGLAIYKTNKFINCYYDGRFRYDYIPTELMLKHISTYGNIQIKSPSYADEDCEHRHFHYQAILLNGAKIFISPKILFPDESNNPPNNPPNNLPNIMGNIIWNTKTQNSRMKMNI